MGDREIVRLEDSLLLSSVRGRAAFIIAKVTLIVAALTSLLLLPAPNASAQSGQLPTILLSRQLATAEDAVGDTVRSREHRTAVRRAVRVGALLTIADPMRLARSGSSARLHLPISCAPAERPSLSGGR